MRDLLIIATPPARRLAVKTFVREYDSLVVRRRSCVKFCAGGRFIISTMMWKTSRKLPNGWQNWCLKHGLPSVTGRCASANERVMNDFHHQRFNVLVCTTIIETGIDIPTANTIIIERADRIGLAQLHQLRGRVGRSHHQAYAWLLTPHPKAMTTDAQKRLEAIASLEDLGRRLCAGNARSGDPRRGVNCLAKNKVAQWKPSVSRCIWSCWKTPSMH